MYKYFIRKKLLCNKVKSILKYNTHNRYSGRTENDVVY